MTTNDATIKDAARANGLGEVAACLSVKRSEVKAAIDAQEDARLREGGGTE